MRRRAPSARGWGCSPSRRGARYPGVREPVPKASLGVSEIGAADRGLSAGDGFTGCWRPWVRGGYVHRNKGHPAFTPLGLRPLGDGRR